MTPRPRRSSPGLKWIAVAVAITGAVYFSRGWLKASRKPVYPPNAFYQVKRGDLLISVKEDGALRALNETVVRSGLEGLNRIIQLAPEGAHVKKGELLVEFDSSLLKERLVEQELLYQERLFQVLQAKNNLEIQKSLAQSQIKDAELALELAESDLEKYRDADAPYLIKTVESRSAVLAEQVRIASERNKRTQELFKTGNATRSELEADALSLKREELALGQYQEDLRLIKKYDQPNQIRLLESKVIQAKGDLDRLRQRTSNEVAQALADLKTSERSIEFLEESLETQKVRLKNAQIFAPQDGLVVYAAVNPFQNFGGGDSRRDESRFGRGRGAGSGGDSRGGRRGGRSSSEGSLGGTSSSSSAQSVASANQRIASAISGAAAAEGGAGGGGGSSGSASSGARGGGGGGEAQSASRSFASYASMRPSSTIPTGSGSGNGAGSGSSGSSSSVSLSSSSGGGQSSYMTGSSQLGLRSSSQSYNVFSMFENSSSGVLEEGAMVRQRQELIRLPDVSKMLAEINIPEARVRQVRAGMLAYVRIENIPGRLFKGTVRRVAILPDAQASWLNPDVKVFATDVLIEDELPDLKPGVSARAEIVITNLSKVLSVPIQTVARLGGQNVCFVKKHRGVSPVPVTTGLFNDGFVEVVSGLNEGDYVLLAPVGDEAIDTSSNTNETTGPSEPPAVPPPPPQPASGSVELEQSIQRPLSAEPSENGEPPAGRRGRRGGGRRSQNAEEAPE